MRSGNDVLNHSNDKISINMRYWFMTKGVTGWFRIGVPNRCGGVIRGWLGVYEGVQFYKNVWNDDILKPDWKDVIIYRRYRRSRKTSEYSRGCREGLLGGQITVFIILLTFRKCTMHCNIASYVTSLNWRSAILVKLKRRYIGRNKAVRCQRRPDSDWKWGHESESKDAGDPSLRLHPINTATCDLGPGPPKITPYGLYSRRMECTVNKRTIARCLLFLWIVRALNTAV